MLEESKSLINEESARRAIRQQLTAVSPTGWCGYSEDGDEEHQRVQIGSMRGNRKMMTPLLGGGEMKTKWRKRVAGSDRINREEEDELSAGNKGVDGSRKK